MRKAETYRAVRRNKGRGVRWAICRMDRRITGETRSEYDRRIWREKQAAAK